MSFLGGDLDFMEYDKFLFKLNEKYGDLVRLDLFNQKQVIHYIFFNYSIFKSLIFNKINKRSSHINQSMLGLYSKTKIQTR